MEPSTIHFNQPVPQLKTKQACRKHFEELGAVSTWKELASVKYPHIYADRIRIFTEKFFQEGLKTLYIAITSYFSSPAPIEENPEITFKLVFDNAGTIELKTNHLWLLMSIGKEPFQAYYLKRCNDESPYLKFAQLLLSEYENGGDVKVELENESDSVSKLIGRTFGIRSISCSFGSMPLRALIASTPSPP